MPSDRKQSVTVDAGNQGANTDALQSLLDTASVATNVVRVHRLNQRDVAVGIEPTGEFVAVEVEVTFDGPAPSGTEWADVTLPGALEAVV